MTNSTKYGIKVRAAFSFDGGRSWRWDTFTFAGGNKHAAIIEHATAIGATSWDFGQADVTEVRL